MNLYFTPYVLHNSLNLYFEPITIKTIKIVIKSTKMLLLLLHNKININNHLFCCELYRQ